jgi:phosphatidylserine/phosphatidylglycerophosphate/cardiolipin synthase-like enzyme
MTYSSRPGYDVVDYWGHRIAGAIRRGNTVVPLVDGVETLNAMYEVIAACIHNRAPGNYIYLLAWYLDSALPLGRKPSGQKGAYEPIPGSSMRALLPQASQAGIQVRVILWDTPLFQNSEEHKWINQLKNGAAILDDNTPKAGSLGAHFGGAHHQKVLIVRNGTKLVAFCGGVDINRDRVEVTDKQAGSPMHDVHCRIEGPAANDLVHVFVQRWLGHWQHRALDAVAKLRAFPADTVAKDPGTAPPNTQYVRIVRTFNFIGNRQTCQKDYSLKDGFIHAIRAARDFIYIEDQYFTNFYAADYLKAALRRIRYLIVVTSDSAMVESVVQPWARRHQLISELMSVPNARDKLLVFYRHRTDTTTARDGYVHAKTWIIDDELAIIGSANFDRRAWGFQTEVAALIFDKPASVKDPSFAQRLRMRLWAEHLGVAEDDVRYPLGTAIDYWKKPGPKAAIAKYEVDGGHDLKENLPLDDDTDPAGIEKKCTSCAESLDEALEP